MAKASSSDKQLMIVLTECLTKSSLENPSDSTAPPWVASVSMDPEMSSTQIMDAGSLVAGASGAVILRFMSRSLLKTVDCFSTVRN